MGNLSRILLYLFILVLWPTPGVAFALQQPNTGFGPSEPPVRAEARALLDEAARLSSAGKYKEAVPPAERAVALLEQALGVDHPDLAGPLTNLGEHYAHAGEYARGMQALERALAIGERAHGPEHAQVADTLSNLGYIHNLTSTPAQGLPLLVRALSIRERTLGPDHPDVAETLNDLATTHEHLGQYAMAEPLYQRALAIMEKAHGPENEHVASLLSNLALNYSYQGLRAKAEPLNVRALEIREKVLGPDHPGVSTSLINLASIYLDQSLLSKAEPLFQRAIAIREKAYGPEHPEVATAVNHLGLLYQAQGSYLRAEPLLARALAVREKTLGPEHTNVTRSLNNLALLYQAQGDFARAEPLMLRAVEIREKTLGPEHPNVGISVNNLGLLYRDQGDFAKAETYLLRAVAIAEKTLGPEHPDLATFLNNLAAAYRDQGDYARAEPLFARALAIREKVFGAAHSSVALTLGNLAGVHRDRGEYAKAEPLYVRALDIQEKALGPEHMHVAHALNNLGLLYQARGEYAKARPVFERALGIREKVFGPDHRDVAATLNNLATVALATGRVEEAMEFQVRGNDTREREISRNLVVGSERSKLLYLGLTAAELDRTLSMLVRSPATDSGARASAMQIVLRRKGRALDATTADVERLRRGATPEDQKLLDELADARSQLAVATLKGPGTRATDRFRAFLRILDERVESLEGRIARTSARFRAGTAAVTIDAVRKAIPPGTALVEYASYRPFDPTAPADRQFGAPRYLAFVLLAGSEPRWVDLGEGAPIDAAVERWRGALRDPKRADARTLARELEAMVMKPVRALLADTRHLLVSPDSVLNLIPFAALVDERDRYLVERYSITYLTSGRDLLRLRERSESRDLALVVANPAYGVTAGVSGSETREVFHKTMAASAPSVDFAGVSFPELRFTEAEARALGRLLPGARILTGGRATEGALKQATGPKVVHLATHGFFLEDLEVGTPGARGVGVSGDVKPERVENPLLRSGLAMAGANARQSGGEDGVLTALEVAGLDLWGTKLVVLSACDTGLGEVHLVEGVYGLRRALVLAGSESQVMSLWSVSDRATRDLMVAYYTGLVRGEGRTEALRRVQMRMLKSPATRHPFFWAGFIQSGEWADLDGKR